MILRRKIDGRLWTLEGLYQSPWGFIAEWVSPDGDDWCELLDRDYLVSKWMIIGELDPSSLTTEHFSACYVTDFNL